MHPPKGLAQGNRPKVCGAVGAKSASGHLPPIGKQVMSDHFPNSINDKNDLTYSHGGNVPNSNRLRALGQSWRLCRQACVAMGRFRAGLRDGGGASPAVSLAAGRRWHGGRPVSLRGSRTVPLAYRARFRVARGPRLSCSRESGCLFSPLRVLRGFCGRTVGGLADGAGRGASPRQDQDRHAPRLYRGDGFSPQRRALPIEGAFRRRACAGTDAVPGPAFDAPGAAFRGRHLRAPKGQAAPPRPREPSRRL